MNINEVFAAAVRGCSELPQIVHYAASSAQGLEESSLDSTYLDFLDEQIGLNARGNEWSDRLRRRRAGLASWCDRTLIYGRIPVGTDDYTAWVDWQTQSVVYWEKYANINETGRPT